MKPNAMKPKRSERAGAFGGDEAEKRAGSPPNYGILPGNSTLFAVAAGFRSPRHYRPQKGRAEHEIHQRPCSWCSAFCSLCSKAAIHTYRHFSARRLPSRLDLEIPQAPAARKTAG